MSTTAADLQSLNKSNSRTTTSPVGIDSANTVSYPYTIPKGWKIHISFPDAIAIVIQPFVIEVKLLGEEYLATGHISNSYEFGSTPGQAIKHYLEILADELTWLEEHEAELSASVREDLHLLQNYLSIA